MRSILRRLLCAVLCLCLLAPSLAVAEQDAAGLKFDLQFQMDPAAFPLEQQKVASGLADLLNILTLQGTLDQSFTGCFDLNASFMLAGEETTRTPFRLYGTESHWAVKSSLLGDEMLMVNMVALLEFAIKAYFHLNVPLQRAAMLVSPYVHTSAFENLISAWSTVMLAQEGKRTIPRKDVLALAAQLTEIAENERSFQYWVKALAIESGYDEDILDVAMSLEEWADSFVGKKGIVITTKGSTETWQTGSTTLFTRTVEDSVTAWSVTLPVTPNGYLASAYYNGQPNGEHVLRISIMDEYEDHILDATVKANNIPDLTCEVPIASPFSLEVEMTGEALAEDVHVLFQGEGENGYFTLSMLNPKTMQPQLTMSGTLNTYTPDAVPSYETQELLEGVNLLSINDTTLTELLSNIGKPMVEGMFPLLVHMPASSIQTLLDLLTDSGILGLLASGGATSYGEEDFGEEYYDEEFYGEEDWDEEEYYEEYDPDAFTGVEE